MLARVCSTTTPPVLAQPSGPARCPTPSRCASTCRSSTARGCETAPTPARSRRARAARQSRGRAAPRSADPTRTGCHGPACAEPPTPTSTRSTASVELVPRDRAPAGAGEWTARELYPGPDVRTRAELRDYVRRTFGSYHHQVGTCRMGVGRRRGRRSRSCASTASRACASPTRRSCRSSRPATQRADADDRREGVRPCSPPRRTELVSALPSTTPVDIGWTVRR